MKTKCHHCGGAINPTALLAATQKGGTKNFSAAERKRRAGRMGEIVADLDEVLRLKQITGLAELFANREFSEAWEAE